MASRTASGERRAPRRGAARRGRSRRTEALAGAAIAVMLIVGCGRTGGQYRRADATPSTDSRAVATAPSNAAVPTSRGSVAPTRARVLDKSKVPECSRPGTDQVIEVADPTAEAGQRAIWVHRPPGPDRADIPVLYLLHGSTTSEETLRKLNVGAIFDAAMCRTGVPFVVAAPNGHVRDGSDTEWADADDQRFLIETFVTQRAIAEVEGSHRRSSALRAIGGVSMGGYGAAAIALRHPDLYRQVLCFAGYFHTDDRSRLFVAHDADHAPDQLINRPAAKGLRWFLVEGASDHDPLMRGTIGGEADRFAAILRKLGFTYVVQHPPGGHAFETWLPTFPAATRFLVEGWTQA